MKFKKKSEGPSAEFEEEEDDEQGQISDSVRKEDTKKEKDKERDKEKEKERKKEKKKRKEREKYEKRGSREIYSDSDYDPEVQQLLQIPTLSPPPPSIVSRISPFPFPVTSTN